MPEEHPQRCSTPRFHSVLLCALLVASLGAIESSAAEDAGIVIYKLPGSAVKPGPAETEVVLAVEIDQVVVATQTVFVPAEDPPRDRLIEVLAGQPAARADIERRLSGGAHDPAVVVRVDGKQYQRLNWKELLAPTPIEPASAQSLAGTRSLTTAQQQCSQRCNDEYDLCLRTCEPYSGPNACWDCAAQVQSCGSFCTSCPRRWRTYGSWTEVLPRQATGQLLCAFEQSAGAVRLHKEYQQRYTRPVTEFTENCDHSITRVTTYETRIGETCWTQIGGCNYANDVFGSRKKCP